MAAANPLRVYGALSDILGLARTHAWQPTLAWDAELLLRFDVERDHEHFSAVDLLVE